MTDIKPDVVVTDLPDASPSDPLEALSWLGESVEEVAEGLRARGIKGSISNPFACPLHWYLFEFGWEYTICERYIHPTGNYLDENIPVGPTITTFVRDFDAGNYPDLIQP